ncbi:Na+/H+-dicarboxylate symporter [Streptomyces sp. SAI-144]|nr:Na+/H+-dicarboxylate symporter [Streptomyces sp. SAI-144]MDH6493196.1 Na+/H+-dicarboxylate symporter [Streptomyces sp. SAI-127]
MLIFGIDKFMSECRALVNFFGNAVATLSVAKWENGLDLERARAVLSGKAGEPPLTTEAETEAETEDVRPVAALPAPQTAEVPS